MSDKNNKSYPVISPEKNRDDTPSFIREVNRKSEIMMSAIPRRDTLPVLEVPANVRLWMKIRKPFYITVLVIIAITLGLLLRDYLIIRSIKNTISEAYTFETFGTLDKLSHAQRSVANLADEYPKRDKAVAAFAWQSVLNFMIFGEKVPDPGILDAVLKMSDDESDKMRMAAKAAVLIYRKDFSGAMAIIKDKSDPRMTLLKAWVHVKSGNNLKARNTYVDGVKLSPQYVPLALSHLIFELELDSLHSQIEATKQLMVVSPGHTVGKLASIYFGLPGWMEKSYENDHLEELLNKITALQKITDKAPFKVKVLGKYLLGLTNFHLGKYDAATSSLKFALDSIATPRHLAWYVLAVNKGKGPVEALGVIKKHSSISGHLVFDITTRLRLDIHDILGAKKSLKKLKTGDYRVKELTFTTAVMEGDEKTARANLPSLVDKNNLWAVLETFHMAVAIGDHPVWDKIVSLLEEEYSKCADAIRAWHSNDIDLAYNLLLPANPSLCVDALATRLLPGKHKPEIIKPAILRAIDGMPHNLLLKIDLVRVVRFLEGNKAALNLLSKIDKKKYEAPSLAAKACSVFQEMNEDEKCLEVINDCDTPQCLYLKIKSLRKLKKYGKAQKTISNLLNKKEIHPAKNAVKIDELVRNEKYKDAIERGEKDVSHQGYWTDEITQSVAQSKNIIGDRVEADRFFASVSYHAKKEVGLGESWEIKLAQAILNIKRGGKFKYKAIFIMNELEQDGVLVPDLYYNLAVIHAREGNERGAVRFLRKAIDLNKAYEAAWKKLSELEVLDENEMADMKKYCPHLKL